MRRVDVIRRQSLVGLALAAVAGTCAGQVTAGEPILFVPGICEAAGDLKDLASNIIAYLTAPGSPNLSNYPNSALYSVYYDGAAVRPLPGGPDPSSSQSPRFFAMSFTDPNGNPTPSGDVSKDAVAVAGVSIVNKADELAHVVHAITSLTRSKTVIIVSHSQGGLVSRAYAENLATAYSSSCTDTVDYQTCSFGATPYAQDIAKLVTLDTPHAGADLDTLLHQSGLAPLLSGTVGAWGVCFAVDTLNQRELETTSTLVGLLDVRVGTLPSALTLASIQSYIAPGAFSDADDGVLTVADQSFQKSIVGFSPPPSTYYDVPNKF